MFRPVWRRAHRAAPNTGAALLFALKHRAAAGEKLWETVHKNFLIYPLDFWKASG